MSKRKIVNRRDTVTLHLKSGHLINISPASLMDYEELMYKKVHGIKRYFRFQEWLCVDRKEISAITWQEGSLY